MKNSTLIRVYKYVKFELSKTVRDWSSKFIDIVMRDIDESLKDVLCDVSVYRENQTLPRELVALISSLQQRNSHFSKVMSFHALYTQLTGF